MEATFVNCPGCNKALYAAVPHCPYCGRTTAAPASVETESPAPAEAAAPAVQAPAEAPPPKAEPAPVPGPTKGKPRPAVLPSAPSPAPAPVAEPSATHVEPPPETAPAKPGSSKVGLVAAVLLVAVGGLYLFGKSSKKDDACDLALTQSASLLAGGNATGARSQAVLAMASCSGEARTKASDMLATADKGIAAQAICERSFRQIGSLIADHRLVRARSSLDQLDTACVESPQGKDLHEKIETGQAAATAADAAMRKQLTDGDLKGARESLDQVVASNREYPELGTLRQELQAAVKAQETAQVAAAPPPSPAHEPVPTKSAPAPSPITAPAPAATVPAVNPQAEMAQSFLRDAETALRQLKFDAAKTYVESARRMDPNNPQAAALARRIRDRELQYLKDETSIK